MAGFRKAKAEQAAIKMGLYGPTGTGKTFSALRFAEGLAKLSGKRVAFVDTEHGTDFYCQHVKERTVHPEPFDFDAIYTKSLTEVLNEVRRIDEKVYCAVVVDSITHLWEAARAAYSGRETGAGTIPFHAWGKIKKPYKDLINHLINSSMHVFICGRQGNEFAEDDEGELKRVGVKMKAEGETPYEPHILLRMECQKTDKGAGIIQAFVEKDRTGIISGRTIQWPSFDNVIKPLLPLLGSTQAKIEDEDETARKDAEAIQAEDSRREAKSQEWFREFTAKFNLAKTDQEVERVSKEITAAIKKDMTTAHVAELRNLYAQSKQRVQPVLVPTGDEIPY